jgi:hypothetical protein
MAEPPGRFAHRGGREGRKQGSSFSEEKEAKRLFPLGARSRGRSIGRAEGEKFFGSFFQKRTILTFS